MKNTGFAVLSIFGVFIIAFSSFFFGNPIKAASENTTDNGSNINSGNNTIIEILSSDNNSTLSSNNSGPSENQFSTSDNQSLTSDNQTSTSDNRSSTSDNQTSTSDNQSIPLSPPPSSILPASENASDNRSLSGKNTPPSLYIDSSRSAMTGLLLQFTVKASDKDNDPLIYAASNLPEGAAFDTDTQIFTWTPTAAGTYSGIEFSVTDNKSPPVTGTMTITVLDSSLFQGTIIYSIDGSLWKINANGTEKTNLNVKGNSPRWSNDGSKIVFANAQGGDSEIYIMDPDGSNIKQLTDNNVDDSSPSWNPDDTKIAFYSNNPSNPGIWVMNSDGSDPIGLGVRGGNPVWSPDGTKIAFVTLGTQELQPGIYVCNPDGSNVNRIGAFTYSSIATNIEWTPDSKNVAYIGGSIHAIVLVNIATGPIPEIRASALTFYTFSPDGNWLATNYFGMNGLVIRSYDILNNIMIPLTDDDIFSLSSNPSWFIPGTLPTTTPPTTTPPTTTPTATTTAPATSTTPTATTTAPAITTTPAAQYMLTINVTGKGVVFRDPNQPSYKAGTKVKLTANPAPGYVFCGWNGAITGSANTAVITMNSDVTINAIFALKAVPTPTPSATSPSTPQYTTIITQVNNVTVIVNLTIFITNEGKAINDVEVIGVDTNVWLNIPTGTICLGSTGAVLSSISIVKFTSAPSGIPTAGMISPVYSLAPDGAKFSPAAIIFFKYDTTLIPRWATEKNLQIVYWDTTTARWKSLDTVIDTENHIAFALLTHTSYYSLWVDPPAESAAASPTATVAASPTLAPTSEEIIPATQTTQAQATATAPAASTTTISVNADDTGGFNIGIVLLVIGGVVFAVVVIVMVIAYRRENPNILLNRKDTENKKNPDDKKDEPPKNDK